MYRKNTASQFVCFQMLLTATGAVATGLSPAARRCIDGTFAAGGGSVTEDGSTGSYKYAMAQADTNGNDISLIFSAATAMPVCINFVTTAADPTNAASFGITNIDATITSRMASYTQPTNFLTATFPSGTVANTTNITAGVITTVTNLTNAPTSGDLTATMKTSVTTAATAATPVAASVTAAVAVTSNVKKAAAIANFPFAMTDSTTHAPKTGVTVTAQISKDGGAFATCTNSGTITEIASGGYALSLTSSETNCNAFLLRFTGTASDDQLIPVFTQP